MTDVTLLTECLHYRWKRSRMVGLHKSKPSIDALVAFDMAAVAARARRRTSG